MRTIWKYQVPFAASSKLKLPVDAQIIQVSATWELITFWAIVETKNVEIEHEILVHGTGFELPQGLGVADHVHSAFMMGEGASHAFVWHVFLRRPTVDEINAHFEENP